MKDDPSSDSAARALLGLIGGHRVTAVIHTAVQLGLPDLLTTGEKATADLARSTGTHEDSLERLLNALVALGLCTRGDGGFGLTEMGRHLASDSPSSLEV